MSDGSTLDTGARTGAQYLDGLRADGREIWLGGERIDDVVSHPKLGAAARSMAALFDFQHAHPDEMLMPSPTTGKLVNVTHIEPKSQADLERRRIAIKLWSELHGGIMGRSPDYLNVTFALFAARADVWARRGNERGAENVVNYHRLMRDRDLSTTHTLINPQIDRSRPDAEAGAGEISLHKVGESAEGIIVRGARMLATLAPYADEISVYPGSPLRLQDTRYALCFAIPMNTPGLKVILRDSYAKADRPRFDYPLSSRFDEQDGVVIFDDVVVPWDRVFLDGDTVGHDEVISHTNWRAHIVHQAMTRAWTKLELAFGLGHAMADATGVNSFDHVQEKLGEIWSMLEMTRSGVIAAEAGSFQAEPSDDWTPDERPFVALRGLMPKWIPRSFELLRLIGGGGFMMTPSLADIEGPMGPEIERYYQARNMGSRDRIRLFRLAWDLIGSDLGSRGELYERFYLSDSYRMTALAYTLADKTGPNALVQRFLEDER
jgi:4-hydroxyphenylacetate 3-monooxygenase